MTLALTSNGYLIFGGKIDEVMQKEMSVSALLTPLLSDSRNPEEKKVIHYYLIKTTQGTKLFISSEVEVPDLAKKFLAATYDQNNVNVEFKQYKDVHFEIFFDADTMRETWNVILHKRMNPK